MAPSTIMAKLFFLLSTFTPVLGEEPSIHAQGVDLSISAPNGAIRFSTTYGVVDISQVLQTIKTQSDIQASISSVNASVNNVSKALAEELGGVLRKAEESETLLQGSIGGLDTRLQAVEGKMLLLANVSARLTDLERYVASIPLTSPTCIAINLDNGVVDVFGEHGANVPVSVTVTFICDDGYYLQGVRTATCQTTGWSATTPTCKRCADNCGLCTDANTCTQCSNPVEYYVKNDRCTAGRLGEVFDRPAESCLALKTDFSRLTNGFYWLTDKDTGNPQRFECDMDNGGWTLIGNGIGGTVGCWFSSRDRTCKPAGYGTTLETFKFSDRTINGFVTRAFKFQNNNSLSGAWYWRGGEKSTCEYSHFLPSQNDCNCAYQEPDFSDSCNPSNTVAANHLALGDWGGAVGCLHVNQRSNPNGWYFRKNGVTNCASYCTGAKESCDVQLYVI